MKTFLLVLALGLTPLTFTGCATVKPGTTQTAARLHGVIKLAAYVGTTESLRQHPEWRSGFELALVELKRIETVEKIDFTTILAIVNRLPVKELRSERATMFITSGTILLHEQLQSIDLEKAEDLRGTVKALREGIELGL